MHVVSAEKRNWYYGLRNTVGGYLTKRLMARGYTKKSPIPDRDVRVNSFAKRACFVPVENLRKKCAVRQVIHKLEVQGDAQKLKAMTSLIKASSLAPVYRETPEKPPWMRLPAW